MDEIIKFILIRVALYVPFLTIFIYMILNSKKVALWGCKQKYEKVPIPAEEYMEDIRFWGQSGLVLSGIVFLLVMLPVLRLI